MTPLRIVLLVLGAAVLIALGVGWYLVSTACYICF